MPTVDDDRNGCCEQARDILRLILFAENKELSHKHINSCIVLLKQQTGREDYRLEDVRVLHKLVEWLDIVDSSTYSDIVLILKRISQLSPSLFDSQTTEMMLNGTVVRWVENACSLDCETEFLFIQLVWLFTNIISIKKLHSVCYEETLKRFINYISRQEDIFDSLDAGIVESIIFGFLKKIHVSGYCRACWVDIGKFLMSYCNIVPVDQNTNTLRAVSFLLDSVGQGDVEDQFVRWAEDDILPYCLDHVDEICLNPMLSVIGNFASFAAPSRLWRLLFAVMDANVNGPLPIIEEMLFLWVISNFVLEEAMMITENQHKLFGFLLSRAEYHVHKGIIKKALEVFRNYYSIVEENLGVFEIFVDYIEKLSVDINTVLSSNELDFLNRRIMRNHCHHIEDTFANTYYLYKCDPSLLVLPS
ncbi:hypothetical protein PCE1_004294 [Barthelona sp. PCE]